MKKLLNALVIVSTVFTACTDADTNSGANQKDKYEQTKETLADTEKKNPMRFLSVEGRDRKNILRQTVIKGTVTNKATVASFKDVDVEISFFSKTGALLEKDHEVIYETIEPGKQVDFKTKILAPTGTDSVALKIYAA
jgi:Ni/Co efflux regulator RcnB